MFLPHASRANALQTPTATPTDLLSASAARHRKQSSPARLLGPALSAGEDLLVTPGAAEARGQMIDQLCRLMIGREAASLPGRTCFSLEDLQIKGRTISTGFIGGKALAVAGRASGRPGRWEKHLERHDSFRRLRYLLLMQRLVEPADRQKAEEGT
jgi:hypothetical protein